MLVFDIEIPRERAAKSAYWIKEDMRPIGSHVAYKLNKFFEETGVKDSGGIYMMFNRLGEILYIGKAHKFSQRMTSHHKFRDEQMQIEIDKIRFFNTEGGDIFTEENEISSKNILKDLEEALIVKEQTRYNIASCNLNEVKAYVDAYATQMLSLADIEIEIGNIYKSDCLADINKDYKLYTELSQYFHFADKFDCDGLSPEKLAYADWHDSGIPNKECLKNIFYTKNIKLKYIGVIFGVPEEHIRRKIFDSEYQTAVDKVYGVGVVDVMS